jgi:hypothetical protein
MTVVIIAYSFRGIEYYPIYDTPETCSLPHVPTKKPILTLSSWDMYGKFKTHGAVARIGFQDDLPIHSVRD